MRPMSGGGSDPHRAEERSERKRDVRGESSRARSGVDRSQAQVRIWEIVGQRAAARQEVAQPEGVQNLEVQDPDLDDVAGLRALHPDRTRERVRPGATVGDRRIYVLEALRDLIWIDPPPASSSLSRPRARSVSTRTRSPESMRRTGSRLPL